ncbi:hypothetical protein [Aphanothece sacrum]|uniref:Glucose-6-phosphatedehydrogenase-6-phosphogluconolactonase n=1 Tax=Aphanothece sacrum FPU1 TaxID=1920663 RepID=A0A401IEN8_APHSA|nr:hypothetical protein [Aphanothece sacrum]GBF79704.1 glucose-6-phosphatedehydrogenase-6-phosphogluconolactonase [Aphanothece sacrum FPU1]GBF87166.1 glucose-6-phosphatedehydrogenase-6-phosphogluconolactonase [Aphanothece sacrum FPU3]
MTTITVGTGSGLPSTINELTKLILWNAIKIKEIQPKEQRNLYENFPTQRIMTYQIFETPNYGVRCALQLIIKLNSDWLSTTGKTWEKAVPILINEDSPQGAVNTFTPGTGGSIPSGVNTQAKLAMWCVDAASRTNPTGQIVEDENVGSIPLVQLSLGKAFDGFETALIRYSIPLSQTHLSQTTPLWEQALAFNYVPLPSDLLV